MKETGPEGGYICLCRFATDSSAVMAKPRSEFGTHARIRILVAPLKELQNIFLKKVP